ncbi:hypothetical protein [Pediococcus claussenii]|uniref:Uncharacterized protein n=1 Tax=Pediococcus claussenii (strain ATCC BAA-344 / DSM 14800 / JCM 18046 / KCTC 3811 / LMG 21948 / P06) TaxID=701521 RepID=G8PBG6_PEDCP|nr:hypothetical protein [Pediococcus claussenii]AEV95955.1 hypothetical protein PECL_1741 [Pediococcus claussenii ATCC BAA-344]ANZ69444.1 hypothetical protein AYR57_03585 [Pediococcus claussenii]ANZ71264.1 hypothetical protein AYR58_03600 [Pediococcus claussenii]
MIKIFTIIFLVLLEGWFVWSIPNSVKKLKENHKRVHKYQDQTSIEKLSGPWGAGNYSFLIPIQFTFVAIILGGYIIYLVVSLFN